MERLLAATARAEDTHFWFLGLRRTAQQLLAATIGGHRLERIIDCGAGTGRNLEWLARFGNVIGLEPEPIGLELARARGRPIVRGSVVQLPFASRTVDLITLFDVLQCLDDAAERQALLEMRRVLKPAGLALLNVAALEVLHGSHSTMTREVRRYSRHRLGRNPQRLHQSAHQPCCAVDWFGMPSIGASSVPTVLRVKASTRLRVPSPVVNRSFDAALRLEARWLRRGDLPIGTSIMAVLRKPVDAPD